MKPLLFLGCKKEPHNRIINLESIVEVRFSEDRKYIEVLLSNGNVLDFQTDLNNISQALFILNSEAHSKRFEIKPLSGNTFFSKALGFPRLSFKFSHFMELIRTEVLDNQSEKLNLNGVNLNEFEDFFSILYNAKEDVFLKDLGARERGYEEIQTK